jgi:hypothetical protein
MTAPVTVNHPSKWTKLLRLLRIREDDSLIRFDLEQQDMTGELKIQVEMVLIFPRIGTRTH